MAKKCFAFYLSTFRILYFVFLLERSWISRSVYNIFAQVQNTNVFATCARHPNKRKRAASEFLCLFNPRLALPSAGVRAGSPADRELLQRPGGRRHDAVQELQPEEQRQRPWIRWGKQNTSACLPGAFFFFFLKTKEKQKRLETRGGIEGAADSRQLDRSLAQSARSSTEPQCAASQRDVATRWSQEDKRHPVSLDWGQR